jgi:hypothetical protein
MTVVALLADPEHVLLSAVVERGMMEGLTFTVPLELEDAIKRNYAAMLRSFPNALETQDPDSKADWSIEISGVPPFERPSTVHRRMKISLEPGTEQEDGESVLVHVQGMLPPAENSHDAQLFRTWLDEHEAEKPPSMEGGPRYWCDRSDIAYAIVELLKSEPEGHSFHLAGRRQWTLEDTWAEFKELANRTQAGQSGRFNLEHLEAKGVQSIKAVRVDASSPRNNRPPLGPIHRFLEKQDGEGWRPKTPLRQSLMFVLAMLQDDQTA